MKKTKIPFKIGSNKIYITFSKRLIKPDEIIKKIVKKLKLQSFNYDLVERANGIDRLVQHNENVYDIWQKWTHSNNSVKKFEFVLKKNRKLTSRTNQNMSTITKALCKFKQTIHKYNCKLNTDLAKEKTLNRLNDDNDKLLVVCSKESNVVCYEYFYFS
jgi:phage terminase large subunit-like protein